MTDVSTGFRPPCWCPSRWAPTWRLHTNLYKFGKNVSPHIFHKKNYCDLNLGENICIPIFFVFPDSGRNLLSSFDFLFWSILNGVTLKTSNTFMKTWHCQKEHEFGSRVRWRPGKIKPCCYLCDLTCPAFCSHEMDIIIVKVNTALHENSLSGSTAG